MKKIELQQKPHSINIGDKCNYREPNINEDCIFYENGEVIGFYLKKLPNKPRN